METPDRESEAAYKVVINAEEQYSIWPVELENAPGWRDAGKTGTQEECLTFIGEVWQDMRPLSLRQAMAVDPSDPQPPPRQQPD